MPAPLTPPPDAQQLIGFRSNDEWHALLAEVDARVEAIQGWPDAAARQEILELLKGVDAIHREALRRLVRLFKEGVLEQVVTDPAIHTLMELYDLLPEGSEARVTPRTIPIRPAAPTPAPRYPHWVPVLARAEDLASGALRDDIAVDGEPLLIARHDSDWYALDGRCPIDGASMEGARVGGGPPIPCHPVRVDEQGRVMVGFDMGFKPALPSF